MSEVPQASAPTTGLKPATDDAKNRRPAVLSAAELEGRLSVGQWSALFSPEGVGFTPESDAVLALVPDAVIRSTTFIPPKAPRGGFSVRGESAEHTFIGDSATLHFDNGNVPAVRTPLHLPNGLALTYGQIVALAGDFYGLPDAPISDDPKPPARFLAAFGTLVNQPQSVAEANRILQIMQTEIDAVNEAIKKGLQPSTVYAGLGDSLNKQYNVATGGGSAVTDLYPPGRYLALALTNWDHFGTHAITAYTSGHQAAVDQAIAARKAANPAAKRAQLELAYAMNAFADHFLTDLFSSGHLRTPRKELYDVSVAGHEIGSYLAKFMHDEDSCWGLKVQNGMGRQWTAYGDKKLLDTISKDNLSIVEQAVQTSVDEIFNAYTAGAPAPLQALRFVPRLTPLRDWQQRTNPAALFINDGQTVQVRNDLANRYDYSWTRSWTAPGVAAHLAIESTGCANNEIPIELNANIIQLWDNRGQLGMIVYAPRRDNAYGPIWQRDDLGEGSGAVAWLSVIAKEQTNIIQCWDNRGALGMIVYAPDTQGRYGAVWSTANIGAGSGAIAWFTIAVGVDQTNIVQLWNNNGRLGMIVYVPDGAGGYRLGWSNPDMGAGSGALAWFVCDLADKQSHIVQLWNNDAQLGIIVYSPDGAGGYKLAWSDATTGQGSAALAWLTISNEGRTHIVQVRDAGEALGIVVYSPNGAGGYAFSHVTGFEPKMTNTVAWLTADLNGSGTRHLIQLLNNGGRLGMVIYYWPFGGSSPFEIPDLGEGAGAVAWLTPDAGDDTTDIVQLWNNNGQLGIIVYSPVGSGTLSEYRVSGHNDDLGEGSSALAFFTSELLV